MSFYIDNNQGGCLGVVFNPLNKIDYWYENKDNGKVYLNNVSIGTFNNNIFTIKR